MGAVKNRLLLISEQAYYNMLGERVFIVET